VTAKLNATSNVIIFYYDIYVLPSVFYVYYHGNGDSGGSVPSDGNSYGVGATVLVAANPGGLYRSGYSFLGWAYSDTATSTYFVVSGGSVSPSSFVITDDTTLYAVWEKDTVQYGVTYVANGGSGVAPVDANSPYATGSTVAILGQGGLIRDGYVFKGWSQDPNNAVYVSEPGWTFAIEYDVTYYAVWEESTIQYTVTYVANGGFGPAPVDTNSAYTTGSTVVILNQGSLARDGYVFKGWSQDPNNAVYVSEPGWTFAIEYDVTYYAVWEESAVKYTVLHVDELSGEVLEVAGLFDVTGSFVTAVDRVFAGYMFNAVSVDNVLTGYVVGDGSLELKLYYTPDTDIEYVVHYYLHDTTDSIAASKSVDGATMGDTVTEAAKVVAGYFVDAVSKSLTLDVAGNEIMFYYTVDTSIEYEVFYYYDDSVTSIVVE
jgi:uncharacterized repeat protein (TIGR02543 family)